MSRERPVVAIDGPAGAGKSTCALRLAQALDYVLVDTGALYRGVALSARERGIAWTDGAALGAHTAALDLRFENAVDGTPHLLVDGVDRSGDIRTQEIARGASDVSKHPEVRAALLGLQRRLGEHGGVVLEGRDIGTVVFPDAEVKVFLTAGVEVRGKRRHDELHARGESPDLARIVAEIAARDAQDSGREVAPLRPADDAVVLDSSALPLDAVVAQLVSLVRDVAHRRDAR
jgi:CMP/dCMP kinase